MVKASTAQKLGEINLASGQYADAERYLLHSLDLTRESGSVLSDLALLPHLCEVYCRTGRLREAGDVLEKARIIADEAGDLGALKGDLWPAKDLVGASLRRSEEAEAFSKRAINVYQDYGLSWDEARANYEWAIAVKGDGRNALKYIPPVCLAVAPDCGMKYLPREVAFGKLVSIVEGTKIVRRERE